MVKWLVIKNRKYLDLDINWKVGSFYMFVFIGCFRLRLKDYLMWRNFYCIDLQVNVLLDFELWLYMVLFVERQQRLNCLVGNKELRWFIDVNIFVYGSKQNLKYNKRNQY